MRRERRMARQLERSDHAPATARRALQQLVADHPTAAPHMPMLKLLVSEIVTNAIVHPELAPGSQVGLEIAVGADCTRVLVSDAGPGFSPTDPQPRGPGAGGGYGLRLLEAGASRWGTSSADGRFTVWFELDHAEPLEKSA